MNIEQFGKNERIPGNIEIINVSKKIEKGATIKKIHEIYEKIKNGKTIDEKELKNIDGSLEEAEKRVAPVLKKIPPLFKKIAGSLIGKIPVVLSSGGIVENKKTIGRKTNNLDLEKFSTGGISEKRDPDSWMMAGKDFSLKEVVDENIAKQSKLEGKYGEKLMDAASKIGLITPGNVGAYKLDKKLNEKMKKIIDGDF